MIHQTVIDLLKNMDNAKREHRLHAANIILENTNLLDDLVTQTFKVDDKLSIRAAWILEWVCTHDSIDHVLPYLDVFTKNISLIHFDGALRCCAKICEHLAVAYDSKQPNKVKDNLKNKHIDAMIETGFDWLIGDHKIAVKAYTMQTLFSLGKYREWVHPELKHSIETNVIHQSKGTKARGKKILELIKKYTS